MPKAVSGLDLETASGRVANAAIHFAFQMDELLDSFLQASRRSVSRLQDRLIEDLQNGFFPNAPSLINAVTVRYGQELQTVQTQALESLAELAQRSAEAYPRFLNKALRNREARALRSEQLVAFRFDNPFDEEDVEEGEDEEEEDDEIAFLGLTQQELQRLLLIITWNNLTLSQQWQLMIQNQQNQLRVRLGAALANATVAATADETGLSAPSRALLVDEAEAEIKRNLYGGRGVRLRQHPARQVVPNLIRNQLQQVSGAVTSATIRKNREIAGFIWNNLFDGHPICIRCANLHGKFFPADREGHVTGPIQIPLHQLCRCFWTVSIKLVSGVEQRFARPNLPSFEDWFRGQSERFQRKVLGDRRFQLWKSGKIQFRDMVELRRRVPVRIRTLKSLENML